jgi:hypothetical protein
MHMTNPGREARLKLVAADHYPTLPVSRWTSAGSLAQLVAEWMKLECPEGPVNNRPLLEADFEFRGGEASLVGPQIVLPLPLRALPPS